MKKYLAFIMIFVLIVLSIPVKNVKGGTRKFNDDQQKRAEEIAATVSANWDEYGVLPSVAIAQAMQESQLGERSRGHNLWGIRAGAERYMSLEAGIYRYMEVINNGYYDGAPGTTDYRTQLRRILDGGYCVPEGDYYSKAIWIIENYNLAKYDAKMFSDIEKKKEEERQKKEAEKKKKEQEAAEKKERELLKQLAEDASDVETQEAILDMANRTIAKWIGHRYKYAEQLHDELLEECFTTMDDLGIVEDGDKVEFLKTWEPCAETKSYINSLEN